MSITHELIYQMTTEEFRRTDDAFFSWDKGDCSEVGALIVIMKHLLEQGIKDPYYVSSYPKHKELYDLLFNGEKNFIG